MKFNSHAILSIVAALLLAAGCTQQATQAGSPSVQNGRQFQLSREPRGAIGILDARGRDVDGQELVLIGKIGGVTNPWVKGYASFIVSDTTAANVAGHKHADGCDCKFCKQKHRAADSIAVVEIVDRDGKVIRVGAQQLLGLKAGQTVVVRGRARVDSLGCMTLSARGVYIRR